jgi:2-polyprenyl-6-methoxyphenol hydroxylase-like FAD-dependent oxidoreductase
MAGKLPIDDGTGAYLPDHLLTRLTAIRAPKSLYMIVTQSIHKPGARWASDEADHLIWVLVSPRSAYGSGPRALFRDGPALQPLALQLIADWHPALQRMVAETDPTVVSATALQGAEPIEPWDTTNVTLLGDAIHAMPPLQGQGGSTALRDAALLCRKLVEADRGASPLLPAIHEYETAMREYGFDAVRSSMRMATMITSGASPAGASRWPTSRPAPASPRPP